MDIQTLAQQIVPFLAPFLPYLLKAGEKAAEEAGKKLGAAAWEKAKALWAQLRPKVEAKPAAREAVQDVAAYPKDEDARAALRLQLRKLLAEDPALAAEVARLWEEVQAAGVVNLVIAKGDRSVAIGGHVHDSTIVTGDQNQVTQRPTPRGMVLHTVESSMIHAVGYDPERRLLEVVFNSGRVYCYEQVPPEVYEALMAAESKGRFMRAAIIDVYPYRRGPC